MSRSCLQCTEENCQRRQKPDQSGHACEFCGGQLEVHNDFESCAPDALRQRWHERRLRSDSLDCSGVWRFRELLPFVEPGASIVTLREGNTPLVEARRAAEWAGDIRLTVKHQGNNPTGSFKDIGMTACITEAAARGVRVVACASTGNTSSSMAAYAARAGLKAVVFVPGQGISTAKLAQALDFGALVVEVGDRFDQAFQLLNALAADLSLHIVNSTNPYRLEGQKTIVAELLEQRGWEPPAFIVVPGGNLGNVSALGKGLQELKALGLITKVPRLAVIQAAGANPFFRMLAAGRSELVPVAEPRTEATAIRIGNPANWKKARRALAWTDGLCEEVTDEEIRNAKAVLAEDGVGCEPASAATLAGLRKLCRAGKISPGAEVVAVLTGHQLKDTDYILKPRTEGEPSRQRVRVEPTVHALRRALESWASPAGPAEPSR